MDAFTQMSNQHDDNPGNDSIIGGECVAFGNILKLVEQQKKEKEAAHSKIAELETQLKAAKEDVLMHKATIKVLNQMNAEDGSDQENMKEEIKVLNDICQRLIIKERTSNDELTESRGVLIAAFLEGTFDGNCVDIGVKWLGEVDAAPFLTACRGKHCKHMACIEAARACLSFQKKVSDPNWHPFKFAFVDETHGSVDEIVDEEDETLKNLKSEWGDEVYSSVTTALREMNQYNPSGRCITSELWNFKEGRRAKLEEAISFLVKNMSKFTNKRQKAAEPTSSSISGK